ncbi:hypothetical protein J4Q44_G00350140 [Coregonus suidteri]|uniref:Uncharacterized protein n=1 Tax=Coregonus suidteri TaxID=861788 RepID=A0AAN8Q7F7_9TELE
MKIGLDLNGRSKEKLHLKFLTNGVMFEIHNFASKITTAFQYVVFDILEHNFDLGLQSEQRWKFVSAVTGRLKPIKKKCNNRKYTLEVFTLPDLRKKAKPISEATLLAKASQDKDSSKTLRQKLAQQKQLERNKRVRQSIYQMAREEENAIKFQKAHEVMNNFLMTWFYHDGHVTLQNASETIPNQMDVTSCSVETAALGKEKGPTDVCFKDESDPHPKSFGQVKEEPIFSETAVTKGADEMATPVHKNGGTEIDIKVESDLGLPLRHIKAETNSETVATLYTGEKAMPCQKNEPTDICTKDEPDFHPKSLPQIKEDAPCNGTEETLYMDEMATPGQTNGLNVVSINNESDLHPEMQGAVRGLEQSHLSSTMERTVNNPYPYCRRIGLDLDVKSKLAVQNKLDLYSLTTGVMLEIHDFANEVCASSKEIVVSVIKHYFHLDLENEKLLRSENIGNRLKRLPKRKDMKEKLLKEPFTFTSPVQKPCQKTAAKGTTRPNASLVSKCQSLKDISERRRLDVKKRKEEKNSQ